jgi:hypothetical protein
MSLWNSPLEISFPELFLSLVREGFPELGEKDEGICLYADNLSYLDGIFSCQLLVTFAFGRKYFSSFNRMGKAINILIENADTGQSYQMNLDDPHKTYPENSGDNFNPDNAKNFDGIKTSYREIPLTIELDNPGWGPHLFIRAVLQDFTSNTLAVDFTEDVSISSFLDGKTHTLMLSEEESEGDE